MFLVEVVVKAVTGMDGFQSPFIVEAKSCLRTDELMIGFIDVVMFDMPDRDFPFPVVRSES